MHKKTLTGKVSATRKYDKPIRNALQKPFSSSTLSTASSSNKKWKKREREREELGDVKQQK